MINMILSYEWDGNIVRQNDYVGRNYDDDDDDDEMRGERERSQMAVAK